MQLELNDLVVVASFCLVFSLAIAWLASLIVYGKIAFLKELFPATFQLIRAHIDYLLMAMLLAVTHYLCSQFSVTLSTFTLAMLCIGALYNPFGFLILAVKPEMGNPETPFQKAKILIGFLPATLGFGGAMLAIMGAALR